MGAPKIRPVPPSVVKRASKPIVAAKPKTCDDYEAMTAEALRQYPKIIARLAE